ncbi:MAG: peptidyl-arginine deiminase, partial [Odoribacter sp.]|nr:peptidyl-arginine deiminase [Odoribacter sp.]
MKEAKDLQDLLRIKKEEDVASQFKEIAEMLFQDFHIEKEGVCYDFLEVEFYFYSKEHPDFITYPRNTNAGEWFF